MTVARALMAVCLGVVLAGCGVNEGDVMPSAGVAQRRDPALYGPDDRVEVYQAPEPWRSLAERSVAAMVLEGHFLSRYALCDGGVQLVGKTIGEDNALCSDVRFQEQRLLSSCSTTLIGPRLMLTAAHCMEPQECAHAQFVFGAHLTAPAVMNTIAPEQFYGCRRIVYRDGTRDLLVAELDRPVEPPYAPATLAEAPPQVGGAVAVIGFPSRGPMKVATNCHVLRSLPSSFDTNCDAFGGNSGSAFYDGDAGVFGVYVRGPGDFVPAADRDCKVPSQYDDAGRFPDKPFIAAQPANATSVLDALAEICDAGVVHPRCGRTDACGDGQCSGVETTSSCAVDCPAPSCGDHVCHFTEQRTCPTDCGARDDRAWCEPTADAGTSDAGNEPPPPAKGCGCGSNPALVAPWVLVIALRRVSRRRAR